MAPVSVPFSHTTINALLASGVPAPLGVPPSLPEGGLPCTGNTTRSVFLRRRCKATGLGPPRSLAVGVCRSGPEPAIPPAPLPCFHVNSPGATSLVSHSQLVSGISPAATLQLTAKLWECLAIPRLLEPPPRVLPLRISYWRSAKSYYTSASPPRTPA